jgi:hypothetical protein
MTSLPPSPPKKIIEPKPIPSLMALPLPKIHALDPHSSGLSSHQLSMQETEVWAHCTKSPLPRSAKISPQKEYIRSESPRLKSKSGGEYNTEPHSPPFGKGLPKPHPQSMCIDNDLEFLRLYSKQHLTLEKSHTGPSTPTSLPSSSSNIHQIDSELDLDYLHTNCKDEGNESTVHCQVSEHLHHENSKEQTHCGC